MAITYDTSGELTSAILSSTDCDSEHIEFIRSCTKQKEIL